MARETIGEVTALGLPRAIQLDVDAGRLEAHVDGHVAFIDLRVNGSIIALVHTEVPLALSGQHIAEALAKSVLEFARSNGMTVQPFCPFIVRYIKRHPEFEAIVDPAFPRATRARRE